MESGFSALAQVAGTLFGLVLISLIFAYSTAITRRSKIILPVLTKGKRTNSLFYLLDM